MRASSSIRLPARSSPYRASSSPHPHFHPPAAAATAVSDLHPPPRIACIVIHPRQSLHIFCRGGPIICRHRRPPSTADVVGQRPWPPSMAAVLRRVPRHAAQTYAASILGPILEDGAKFSSIELRRKCDREVCVIERRAEGVEE
uniref:Uncharacterized protein n=1 Tax=Leersia perrieri TaxID=77586 RepID=A0A0D9X8X0_9ORYZ